MKEQEKKRLEEQEDREVIVIDGTYAALGRLAAIAAKNALKGNKVVVCNCEDIIIIGKPKSIIENYKIKFARGLGRQKGPYYSRLPERFVKRTIRGMLPHKKPRGRQAFDRIKCYVGVPEKYKEVEKISLKRQAANFITMSKLCKLV